MIGDQCIYFYYFSTRLNYNKHKTYFLMFKNGNKFFIKIGLDKQAAIQTHWNLKNDNHFHNRMCHVDWKVKKKIKIKSTTKAPTRNMFVCFFISFLTL